MPYKSAWALGLAMLVSQMASAQTTVQPELIPSPVTPPTPGEAVASAPPVMQTIENFRRGPLVYFDADYLQYWVNHGPAPTLLTTAPNNGLNGGKLTGGILGDPSTITLFDAHNLSYGSFSGFRANVGVSLDADGFWALEAGGFFLPQRSVNYGIAGNRNGAPLLSIPFTDAATGLNNSFDVNSQTATLQPYLYGSVQIHSDISVWGYETNVVAHSIRTPGRSVDLLAGFRAMYLNENLNIDQSVSPAQTGNITIQSPITGQGTNSYYNVPMNTPVFVTDQFTTRNQFYGGQVGGRFHWFFGSGLSADLNLKVAMGVTHQQVTINGSSSTAAGDNPTTGVHLTNISTPGGVFAQVNNIGSFTQNPFTVLPEIGLNLRYALTPQIALRVGYSAIYWSNVARPGAQIDPVLNSKLVPTGALQPFPNSINGQTAFVPSQEQGRPYFAFHDTAFWAYGINAGVEFRY